MGPNKQKDGKQESDTGCCKNHRLSPHATRSSFIGEAGADARQERRWKLGVGRGVKACIDGRKERLFLGERGPTRGAGGEVRAQFALWLIAGSGRFD